MLSFSYLIALKVVYRYYATPPQLFPDCMMSSMDGAGDCPMGNEK
jgi:hypothetical protein